MKKGKKTALLLTILMVGLLTACGGQKQAASSSKKATSEQTSVKKHSKSSQKSSSEKSSAVESTSTSSSQGLTSSSTTTSNSTASNSNNSSTVTRLSVFNQQLRNALGNVILPTTDGLENGSNKLNVRYEGNQANYSISYSVGNTAYQLNDEAVSKEIPYVQFKKTSYGTSSEASAQVDYIKQNDLNGLPTIDLGHNITGYEDAGAGQRYLSWYEGNWALTVHATAVNQQDPKTLAVQIVNMLESYRLPAPSQYGVIKADVNSSYGSRNQLIMWQQNNVIYQLNAHDITTAIKMAASMK